MRKEHMKQSLKKPAPGFSYPVQSAFTLRLGVAAFLGCVLVACSPEQATTEPVAQVTSAHGSGLISTEHASVDMSAQEFEQDLATEAELQAGEKAAEAKPAAKLTENELATFESRYATLRDATSLKYAFAAAERLQEMGPGIHHLLKERLTSEEAAPEAFTLIAGSKALFATARLRAEYDVPVELLCTFITGNGERDLRMSACELLGSLTLSWHAERVAEALDAVFDPPLQVELSLILWSNFRNRKGKERLAELLKSDSESIRVQASLALGRLGDLSDARARETVEMLADEPTDRGRIAQSLLEHARLMRRLEKAILDGSRDNAEIKVDNRIIDRARRIIQSYYIFDEPKATARLMLEAARGVVDGFDPYTLFLPSHLAQRAAELRQFSVPTLGLTLGSKPIREGRRASVPTVMSVVPGGPADRAGILPGDRITGIAPGVTMARILQWRTGATIESGEVVQDPLHWGLAGMTNAMSGAIGESVGLQVFRESWLLNRWIRLTHAELNQPVLVTQMLPGELAYARISSFSPEVPAQLTKFLATLKESEVRGLIIDLRSSSLGSVKAATEAAALFLPKDSLVTWSQGRVEAVAPRKDFTTSSDPVDGERPLTIMIDGGTADASEIFAAAMKEHGRAKVVGATTFGRSLLQNLVTVQENEDRHALLLTVGKFHAPKSGEAFFERGVTPDIEIAPATMEGWVYDELDEVLASESWSSYISGLMAERKLVIELAEGDNQDHTLYPGFDEFQSSLKKHLSSEHLRQAIRRELRKRLLAEGASISRVDLQEDHKFAGAIRELAERTKLDLSKYQEYRSISAR